MDIRLHDNNHKKNKTKSKIIVYKKISGRSQIKKKKQLNHQPKKDRK